MRYYQCDTYPIEFVLSENIEKCFAAHNHVGHYVISVVMQGMVYLSVCKAGETVMSQRGCVHCSAICGTFGASEGINRLDKIEK